MSALITRAPRPPDFLAAIPDLVQRLRGGNLVPRIQAEHPDVDRVEPAAAKLTEDVAVGWRSGRRGTSHTRRVYHRGVIQTRTAGCTRNRRRGPEDLRAYGPTDLPRREAVEHGDEDLVQLLVRERAGDTVALRQQPFADHRFDRANQRR